MLREAFGDVVTGEEKKLFDARVREIQELGADGAFSRRLITLRFLDQILEILDIARETGADVVATASAYYQASTRFDIPWLRRKAFAAAGDDPWEQRAVQVLASDLSRAHRTLTVGLIKRAARSEHRTEADYPSLLARREVERFDTISGELREEGDFGFAASSVATRELGAVADRVARREARNG